MNDTSKPATPSVARNECGNLIERLLLAGRHPDFSICMEAAKALRAASPSANVVQSEREVSQLIDERDSFEHMGTVLANKVAELLDADVGEWSSANNPIFRAIHLIEDRLANVAHGERKYTQADMERYGNAYADARDARRARDAQGPIWNPLAEDTPIANAARDCLARLQPALSVLHTMLNKEGLAAGEKVTEELLAEVDGFVGTHSQIANVAQGEEAAVTAMQRYVEFDVDADGLDPIERLRAFCSLAMNGQDWIDVEPFFDALTAPPAQTALTEIAEGMFMPVELGVCYQCRKVSNWNKLSWGLCSGCGDLTAAQSASGGEA